MDKVMKLLPEGMRTKPSPTVVAAWGIFLFVSLLIYKVLSDGDFSFLLTYGTVRGPAVFFLAGGAARV